MRLILLISFAISLLISSCKFKQFHQSEKDLQKHFRISGNQPEFHQLVVSGRPLFYAEIPGPADAPLLVMIHGSPGAWYGYLKQMDDTLLRKNFTMISPDRPGFGKSDGGKSEPSIEIQAAMIAEIIRKERRGRKVIIMGRSYGSPIAALIAAKYPELADALVLASSAVDPDLEKYFKIGKLANPGCMMRGCVPTTMRVANDEKLAHASELRKMIYIWKEIRQPVVILQAADDKIVYPRNGHFLDSALVHSPHQYIQVPDGGHLITWSHPDLVRITLLNLKNKL